MRLITAQGVLVLGALWAVSCILLLVGFVTASLALVYASLAPISLAFIAVLVRPLRPRRRPIPPAAP